MVGSFYTSMVICNFNILGAAFRPHKTNAILVIYTNTVLTSTIPCQCFQSVSWWRTKKGQCLRRLQLGQFANCHIFERSKLTWIAAFIKVSRVFASERLNHTKLYYAERNTSIVTKTAVSPPHHPSSCGTGIGVCMGCCISGMWAGRLS